HRAPDAVAAMAAIDQIEEILKACPKIGRLARIVGCPQPDLHLVQTCRHLVAMARKRAVVRVGLIDAVRQKTPVLCVQDEEEPIEQNQTMLLAVPQVARRIEVVGRVFDVSLDTKAERFKDAILELFANANRILRAALYGPGEQRFATVGRRAAA